MYRKYMAMYNNENCDNFLCGSTNNMNHMWDERKDVIGRKLSAMYTVLWVLFNLLKSTGWNNK